MVGLDTSLFVYAFERHPRYAEVSRAVLRLVELGHLTGVASVVSFMELAVRPFQLGQRATVWRYEAQLTNLPNLDLVGVDFDVALRSAELRAKHGIAPADALIIASAINSGATAFVTNDRRLERVDELAIISIDSLVDTV